jgi:phage terminase large subunit-like protein
MVPASASLHRAIIEGALTLPDDRRIAEHAANAVQRHSRRGWRLDSPDRSSPIDSVVALAMALSRAQVKPAQVKLLGWL